MMTTCIHAHTHTRTHTRPLKRSHMHTHTMPIMDTYMYLHCVHNQHFVSHLNMMHFHNLHTEIHDNIAFIAWSIPHRLTQIWDLVDSYLNTP